MSAGNKGKFSERLKRIAFWKRKKDNLTDDENDAKSSDDRDKTAHSIKRFFLIPIMLVQKKISNSNRKLSSSEVDRIKNEANYGEEIPIDEKEKQLNERKLKVQNIKNIDVVLLRKIHDRNLKRLNKELNQFFTDKEKAAVYEQNVKKKKEEIQREILNLLKKELVEQINELEVLQSDLYILKEIDNNDVIYKKCTENILEIKRILSRIKALKEKYDYLKDNTDFDYLLEVKNAPLYEKIIELKTLLETDKIPFVVDDYKLLEEYRFLYLKIDKFKTDAEKYEEEKKKKAAELKERDIDFEEFKKKVNNVSSLSEGYENFIHEQNQIIMTMEEKINEINSYERVTYSFRGFGTLLANSFRYLGLMLVNPLKGLFPNIAIQTLATRRLIGDLFDSMHLEENRRTIYEATDFSQEINVALNDIDYTEGLIDKSLNDILVLKGKFKEKFEKYNSDIEAYKDAIKKLNKIENAIVNNKIKVGIIRTKMKENERINEQKMAKVRKLNENK